mmetsp:Transcript_7430/g.12368  ORF Transcript_7430/g.12368 Transcript_7430/m.12368 type:complete len:307 (-) Transcript_7430:307-1227(-)
MNDTGLRCTFNVMCTDTSFGETVCVVGDCEELGEWRPEHSLRLHTTDGMYPLWSGYVYINGPSRRLEYKCGKMRGEDVASWNWETFNGNRVLIVNDSCSEVTVSHTWSIKDAYQIEDRSSNLSASRNPSVVSSGPGPGADLHRSLSAPVSNTFYDSEPSRSSEQSTAAQGQGMNGRVVPFFSGPVPPFSRPQDDPGRFLPPQPTPPSSGHRIRPRKSHSFSAYLNRSKYFLDPIAEEADDIAERNQPQRSSDWRWHPSQSHPRPLSEPSRPNSDALITQDDTSIGRGSHPSSSLYHSSHSTPKRLS